MKQTGHSLKVRSPLRPPRKPGRGLRRAGTWGLCLVLGAVLGGFSLLGRPVPLGAALAGALPLGLPGLMGALGAAGGYVLRWGPQGLAGLGQSLLLLTARALFHGTRLTASRWFMPLCAGVTGLAMGAVLWLGGGGGPEALVWLGAFTLMGPVFTWAMEDRLGQRDPVLLWAGVAGGLPRPWGALWACMLLARSRDPVLAGAAAVALELSGSRGLGCALLLGALLGELTPRPGPLRGTVTALAPCAAYVLLGEPGLRELSFMVLGAVLGSALGVWRPAKTPNAPGNGGERLERGAHILRTLRQRLRPGPGEDGASEAETVFDGAAERVCRCCPRFSFCWQTRGAGTYEALTGAAPGILSRGVARRGDFDPAFARSCSQLEAFVRAVNRELDGVLYRRRYRAQVEESRRILAQSLDCVAGFLQAPPREGPEARWRPGIGISTAGRPGSLFNGDRGACFPGERGEYFVLLCDGMGTGEGAAALSGETVHVLRDFLQWGLEPRQALSLLNGAFILEGTGTFATVDLLRLDLAAGTGALYKWGSAPSYFRRGEEVETVGLPGPPPGLSTARGFQEYSFSFREGDYLVLVSDGADRPEIQEDLRGFTGTDPRELAALLIAAVGPEDDRTAVAVTLRAS